MKALRWILEAVVGAVIWVGFLMAFGFFAHVLWTFVVMGWQLW